MKLSILIPSLKSRAKKLKWLINDLNSQLIDFNNYHEAEIIYEIDDKQISTGAKRNNLLLKARGKFIVFIDDDDIVSPDYCFKIINAITLSPNSDCFATEGDYFVDGNYAADWKLSKDYIDYDGADGILYRRTNHLSPVKRELALRAMFPDKSNAEDKEYSERLNRHLKTECKIEGKIYSYMYSTQNKSYS